MNEPVIQIQNVSKSYGDFTAVKSLSFEVEKAECFGLLGPNGAGKTTMMKMIYGKAVRDKNPDCRVSVLGFDPLKDELKIKALSGVVPQDENLDAELNVTENLEIYARLYGIPKKTAKERIEEQLEFMDLTDKSKARIDELSGGMQRRLIIARALINKPQLLILDEPTTGLDPQVRHHIWDKLYKLRNEGVTILLTTHYMEEAFQICDHVLIMHHGEKVMEGKPQQLIDKNIEKYALQVINKKNLDCLTEYSNRVEVQKEESEELAVFYSNDLRLLENMSECLKSGEFYIRQSNLEDLFLKTTGRGLNEE